jgi:hypothetical protein
VQLSVGEAGCVSEVAVRLRLDETQVGGALTELNLWARTDSDAGGLDTATTEGKRQ